MFALHWEFPRLGFLAMGGELMLVVKILWVSLLAVMELDQDRPPAAGLEIGDWRLENYV